MSDLKRRTLLAAFKKRIPFATVGLFVLLVFTTSATVWAAPDGLKKALPLGWLWEPLHQRDNNQGSVIDIEPGDKSIVELPAKTDKGYLLLQQTDSANRPSLQVFAQTAQGFSLPGLVPSVFQQGRLLLPLSRQFRQLTIKNSGHHLVSLNVSLIKLRPEYDLPLLEDEAFHAGSKAPDWFQQHHTQDHTKFVYLDAGEPYQLSVDATKAETWLLESRIIVNDEQSSQVLPDKVVIPLFWNQNPLHTWTTFPVIDREDFWQGASCQWLTSQPDTAYLSIPEGNHTISFVAPQPMLLSVATLSHENKNEGVASITNKVHFSHDYDDAILGLIAGGMPPNHALQAFQDLPLSGSRALEKALSIVERDYHFWREAVIESEEHTQIEFKRIKRNPHNDRGIYYDRAENGAPGFWQRFLVVPENGAITVAPSQQIDEGLVGQDVKLRIHLTHNLSEQSWLIKTSTGEHLPLEWRQALAERRSFSLVSDHRVGIYSANLTMSAEKFPIKLVNMSAQSAYIGIEERVPSTSELSQSQWLDRTLQFGALPTLALLFEHNPPEAEEAAILWRDLSPMRLWMRSYVSDWEAAVTPESPAIEKQITIQKVQNWINSLSEEGEFGLLARLLRGVVIHHDKQDVRQIAYQWLKAYYSEHHQIGSQIALNTVMIRHSIVDASNQMSATQKQLFLELATLALQQRLPKMAARVMSLIEPSDMTPVYWMAHMGADWQFGDRDSAVNQIIQAASLSDWQTMYEQLERLSRQGANLDRLKQNLNAFQDADNVTDLLVRLQSLAGSLPAMPMLPVRISPVTSSGAVRITQTQRALSFSRERLDTSGNTDYKVFGPVSLDVDVRLLHDAPASTLDDWLIVRNLSAKEHATQLYPLLNSQPNANLLLHGGSQKIGRSHRIKIHLGPGFHHLRFKTKKHQAIMSMDARVVGLFTPLMREIQHLAPAPQIKSTASSLAVNDTEIQTLPTCGAISGESKKDFLTARYEANRQLVLNSESPAETWEILQGLSIDMLSPKVESELTPQQALLVALWRQGNAGLDKDLLISRLKFQLRKSPDPETRERLHLLNQGYQWQRITPIKTAGRVRLVNPQDHKSPYFAIRERLMGVTPEPGVTRLYGDRNIALFTKFSSRTLVQFAISQQQIPYRARPNAQIQILLNDKLIKTVGMQNAKKTVNLAIPAGNQRLVLKLANPTSDHWLTIKADVMKEGKKVSLIDDDIVFYDASQRDIFSVYYFDQPGFVRIDEYHPGHVRYRYQWVDQGELTLRQNNQDKPLLTKVYSWQKSDSSSGLAPFPFEASTEPSSQYTQNDFSHRPSYLIWQPAEALDGVAKATAGYYFTYEQRKDFESSVSSGGSDEKIVEAGWRFRQKMHCSQCLWRFDTLLRQHLDEDIGVIGGKLWTDARLFKSSWKWSTYQSLFAQVSPDVETSWYGNLSFSSRHKIGSRQSHQHSISVFGRFLTANTQNQLIDNDVFSRFKDAHKFGVRLQESYSWRPSVNGVLQGKLTASSNEKISLDNMQANIAFRQYWRPWQFHLDASYRYYLADDDRPRDTDQTLLGFSATRWLAQPSGKLWQLGVDANYDVNDDELSFGLFLSVDITRGRGLYDVRPNEESFYRLKGRDVAADMFHHSLNHYEVKE